MKVNALRYESIEVDVDPVGLRELIDRGYDIDAIDDKLVLDMCEFCGMPILEDEDYRTDEDGISWHKSCEK